MGSRRTITGPATPVSGEGSGRVYAGGTPDFDERTGLYRPGSPNEYLNPPSKVPSRKRRQGGSSKRRTLPLPKPGNGKNGGGGRTIRPHKPGDRKMRGGK